MITQHHISFLLVQWSAAFSLARVFHFYFIFSLGSSWTGFVYKKQALWSLQGCVVLSHLGCTHMLNIKPDLLTHVGYIFFLSLLQTLDVI